MLNSIFLLLSSLREVIKLLRIPPTCDTAAAPQLCTSSKPEASLMSAPSDCRLDSELLGGADLNCSLHIYRSQAWKYVWNACCVNTTECPSFYESELLFCQPEMLQPHPATDSGICIKNIYDLFAGEKNL